MFKQLSAIFYILKASRVIRRSLQEIEAASSNPLLRDKWVEQNSMRKAANWFMKGSASWTYSSLRALPPRKHQMFVLFVKGNSEQVSKYAEIQPHHLTRVLHEPDELFRFRIRGQAQANTPRTVPR